MTKFYDQMNTFGDLADSRRDSSDSQKNTRQLSKSNTYRRTEGNMEKFKINKLKFSNEDLRE